MLPAFSCLDILKKRTYNRFLNASLPEMAYSYGIIRALNVRD